MALTVSSITLDEDSGLDPHRSAALQAGFDPAAFRPGVSRDVRAECVITIASCSDLAYHVTRA